MKRKNKIEKYLIIFIWIFILGGIFVHSTPKLSVRWGLIKMFDIKAALTADINEESKYNYNWTKYYYVKCTDNPEKYRFPFVVEQFVFLYFCTDIDHTPTQHSNIED